MNKEKELQKLNKEIKNCRKCPLWKLRKKYSSYGKII
jgi:uracil-DNA glycosylase